MNRIVPITVRYASPWRGWFERPSFGSGQSLAPLVAMGGAIRREVDALFNADLPVFPRQALRGAARTFSRP